MLKRWKKTRTVCDELDITPVTLWRWRKKGIVTEEPVSVNGHDYWPPETSDNVVARMRAESSQA